MDNFVYKFKWTAIVYHAQFSPSPNRPSIDFICPRSETVRCSSTVNPTSCRPLRRFALDRVNRGRANIHGGPELTAPVLHLLRSRCFSFSRRRFLLHRSHFPAGHPSPLGCSSASVRHSLCLTGHSCSPVSSSPVSATSQASVLLVGDSAPQAAVCSGVSHVTPSSSSSVRPTSLLVGSACLSTPPRSLSSTSAASSPSSSVSWPALISSDAFPLNQCSAELIMIGASQSKRRKAFISEEDISLILQRYTANTILALLQEVAQFSGVKIDWNALVKKTSTGISNAREYQMLWRHLAYHDTLLEKLEDGAEPLDDDSDLELELEPFPAISAEASTEAAACVKVLIASGSPSDTGPANRTTVEAPLTINIPNGQTSRTPFDNPQQARSTQGTNITVPVSVQKLSLPSVSSSEQLDGNGPGSSNLPPRRKRKLWTEEEDMELIAAVQKCGEGNWANILKGDFKHDRTAAQLSQRWAIIRKKKPNLKPNAANKSTGPTLTEAQLAARQAVSMALNMPMMGSLSSASAIGTSQPATQATPSNASSHPAATTTEASTLPAPPEASAMPPVSISSSALHQSQQAPNPLAPSKATSNPAAKSRGNSKKQSYPVQCSTGPNPIVQAAAVAAGARIANPVTAATLFRAAQSKTAVHIRQGGSVPASSLPTVANPLANNHIGPRPANIHYIRTGLASSPPVYSNKAQSYMRPATQHVQGGHGKSPSMGPPPSASTAPSSRPTQQGCMDLKTLSHCSVSSHGTAESKKNLTTTTATDTGVQSALEKKPCDLSQALDGPIQEQMSSENLVLKEPIPDLLPSENLVLDEPIKEQPSSENVVLKEPNIEQLSSENLILKEPIKEQVLSPISVLKEGEVTSLELVPREPIQEQLKSMNPVSKEPVQEQAALLNLSSEESMQEQKTCLNSNSGNDHDSVNVADDNEAVLQEQTNVLDQTATEEPHPNEEEKQTVVNNVATENTILMEKPIDPPSKAVGENQTPNGNPNN